MAIFLHTFMCMKTAVLGKCRTTGKYKHGKPDAELSVDEVQAAIEKHRPRLRYRAYVWLLYWIGLRRSEPMFIVKEHVEEKEGSLFITITVDPEIPYSRLKHGIAGGKIELPLKLEGVQEIKELWQKTRKGRRLFNFTDKTGYNVIKQLFPHKSPHWFRHNRITQIRKKIDGKKITLDDVKAFTGLRSDKTVAHYGMKTQEGIHRVSENLE